MKNKTVKPGLYLVINPKKSKKETIEVLTSIQEEDLAAIQIWDHPDLEKIDSEFIEEVISLFHGRTPILINNQWELLNKHNFDGVHFDKIPVHFREIEKEISRSFIKGLTLENDLSMVQLADSLNFDYLSFCAMFPSSTVSSCEIVEPATVLECMKMTNMPVYLSGGITPHNIKKLNNLPYSGIAIVSGIMEAKNPRKAIIEYNTLIRKNNETRNNLT